MKKVIVILGLTIASLFAEVDMKQALPSVTLEGDSGGYVVGGKWGASMLQGKTTMLMYVDPDEKSKGEVFKPTIEAFEKELDFSKFQILVILNLNATWKPNAVIKFLMEDKITTYPKRTYIFDKDSVLVNSWGLNDNEYNTLVINKKGRVIYSHSGEWKEGEITKIDTLIRSQVK